MPCKLSDLVLAVDLDMRHHIGWREVEFDALVVPHDRLSGYGALNQVGARARPGGSDAQQDSRAGLKNLLHEPLVRLAGTVAERFDPKGEADALDDRRLPD